MKRSHAIASAATGVALLGALALGPGLGFRPVLAQAPPAAELEAGTTAVLRATHSLGVPLHPAPNDPSVSARAPDGATVSILSVSHDERWFEVDTGSVRGFVTRRYLERRGPKPPSLAADSPWTSRKACLAALARGLPPRDPKLARIGAWNLHWFPDGGPGAAKPDAGTDLEWLACSLATLRVDVLAVSEIKHGPRAEQALARLGARLSELTGGRWRSLGDGCPRGASQHVGLLYDARRVELAESATIAALNPHGAACKDQLRPGLAGFFRFPGGLDLTVIAAHLKSGPDPRSIALRDRSFAAFANARDEVQAKTGDRDVLVLGDMNTMGCESCSPPITPAAELSRVDAQLGSSALGFRRIPADPGCSHFYSGAATLLDWGAATDLGELPRARRAAVAGLCAELGCTSPRAELPAQRRLSDHCPFVIELDDRDAD